MSNIKINDVYQRIQYAATNGQTQFSIPFPFFSNSYVIVWQDGVVINQGAGAGEYGIAGAGSPSGGTITLVTPAVLDSIITIEGSMPIDRTSIYSATISNLTGSDLNGDFNREVVMMKQIETTQALLQLQYAPWAEISQDDTVTTDRYIPLLAPLQAWRKNAAGTAIEVFTTPSSGGIAPDDATYLVQVSNSELPNAQAMSTLANGLVVNETGTGVQITRELAGVANQTVATNADGQAGDPTIGIADNPVMPGTAGMGIPQGTTAERVIPSDGIGLRFNTDLQQIEFWNGAIWVQLEDSDDVTAVQGFANQILANGTFGTPETGLVELTFSPTADFPGTFNIQGSTAVDEIIDDSTLATATSTNLATAAAIKNYVDSLVAGFNFLAPVNLATTGALTVTYANGASGVGATLTNAGAQAALTVDGSAAAVNDRILIKDQASTLQNGIYTVTDIGSGATNWVLTRATDFDTPAEIQPGDLVTILSGTANALTLWLQTATVTTVGTDPIVFAAFGNAIGNVVTITGIQTITGAKTFSENVAINNSKTLTLNSTTAINAVLDEDNMVSNSATAVPTQQSTKAYVDNSLAGALAPTSINFTTTSGIIGTTTNNNAAAGSVGEVVSSVVLGGSAISLTSNTPANVTSISLTAGDWDVQGNVSIVFSALGSSAAAWTSSTSASNPGLPLLSLNSVSPAALVNQGLTAPFNRFSLSATTTIYLSCYSTFSSGTSVASGSIYARRRR